MHALLSCYNVEYNDLHNYQDQVVFFPHVDTNV